MLRTTLTLALCAALALAAAPLQAGERGQDDDGRSGGRDQPRIERVDLTLRGGWHFRPRGLMVLIDARIVEVPETPGSDFAVDWSKGAYYLPTDKLVEVHDENKLDLGKVPFIGGMIRQDTVTSRFKGAKSFGDAYRMDDLIVVVPLPGAKPAKRIPRTRATVIANQDRSFPVGALFEKVNGKAETPVPHFGDVPVLGNLFRIGDAKWKHRSLLVRIEPHIIDLE